MSHEMIHVYRILVKQNIQLVYRLYNVCLLMESNQYALFYIFIYILLSPTPLPCTFDPQKDPWNVFAVRYLSLCCWVCHSASG